MGYFLHNIRYLFKHKMEDSLRESREETVDLVDQYYRYSLMNNNLSVDKLNVLSSIDTVKYLSKKHTSFCRFGDGEIEIIMGKSIPFQKYDKKLAYLLKKILQSSKDNIEIGVPYVYFHEFEPVNECAKHFMIYGAPRYRKFLLECCDRNKLFIDAAFTQNYMASADVKSFFEYYRAIKKMFCEKKFVLFIGKGIREKIRYDIFDEAEKIDVVEAPTKNAYSKYSELMDKAISYPKEYILCFVLGPTAKVLAFDLAQKGYLAWDLGHLLQDYDAYMKNIERSTENVVQFFSPD